MPGFNEGNILKGEVVEELDIPIKESEDEKNTDFSRPVEKRFRNMGNKKEYWSENLDELLKSKSNNIFKEHLGNQKNPLNEDGTVAMTEFAIGKKEGGLYTTTERKGHKRTIRENEILWIIEKGSKKNETKEEKEERVRKLLKNYLEKSNKFDKREINSILEEYSGEETCFWDYSKNQKAIDAALEQFNNEKEKSFGILWEKAKTILFNEIIGSDYFVVRASTFDDQENKTDNLVIGKDGSIAGAFDDVTTEDDSDFHKQKLDKVQKINERGGTTVCYGITVEGDKIVKTKLENVPILALQISRSELINLLEAICSTDKNEKEKNEKIKKDIFIKIINSSKEQVELLGNSKSKKGKKSFNNLSNLTNQIEKIVETKFPNVMEE